MKLLVFSDIHGDLAALERLLAIEADYYIAAGDLANFAKGLDKAAAVLASRKDRVWLLPGNHEHETATSALCAEHGFGDLHRNSFEAEGWHVAGLGHSNPTPFDTPGESPESELAERLEPFATLDPLILVCHCPPKGCALDEAGPGLHFGSTAIASFIERVQPEWFFCGHIHEAAGRKATFGRTIGINAGKKGWLLEV
ncbi:MAG: metallophosphoesterase [Bryobacteraceae bacterium]|nr:metallophosphoesterase [Solibacteraceae bacterium]MCL4840665.1 metallophosphoesterase [Bryobacteraceae bacterium]MCO5350618.1 metallophosphoesterase [Bryobacteraceae bacterium]HAX42910.1 serine/threonine protein phosphatase [Bryobacterales bacterium]HRJ21415.1 metallophosphoesterase [Bryobacteraceae bacterium]